MQQPELAAWLRKHKESLATALEGEEPLNATLIDYILEAVDTGRTDRLDAAIGMAARQAAMQVVSLDRLLAKPTRLKHAVWRELQQDELSPPNVLALIEAAESIFARVLQVAIRTYFEANQHVQDALASEIARLHDEAERRVRDRTADLARANIELSKLEKARTDFISIAAHELKTPLTLIQGYANMLCEMDLEGGDASGAAHLVVGILRGTERLSTIVENLLDVSVIDTDALSLRIEKVSLSQVVDLVVTQNANYLKDRGLTLRMGDLNQLPEIEFDHRRLHQVLNQLLNNAIRYTPDGGEVFIDGYIPNDPQPAGEILSDGDRFVELVFHDTGIGVAPEDRERIFEKFYRVGKSALHSTGMIKFKGAGPGLGLPIARGLVEAHGGRLWAESPGHDEINCPGSTFHVLLPLRAKPKPGVTVTWVERPNQRTSEAQGE
jgi:signal transduction histidine kinase